MSGGRTRRVVPGLIGAGLAIAAVAITVVEPTDVQTNAPFVTMAPALDHRVATREFELTVTDATLADRLTSDDWIGTTDGVWLVIEVTYASRIDAISLTGTMTIGGTDYLESGRLQSANLSSAYSDPGLAWSRSVGFELPTSALKSADASHAIVQFASSRDARLDGVVQVAFDLTTLPHASTMTIQPPGRVTP